MSKSVLPYTIESNVDSYLNKEVAKRTLSSGGVKVLKKDIIAELADYCGLTWEGMNRIKRELVLPSLPVAFKIAEYFNEDIRNIFKLNEIS